MLTLSSYIMAFITFPYVSRVLGVERIGLVNFVDNTINYFLLFATMGVNLLGVREIAAVKDNSEKRNKVFANLLGLNLGFTVVTLLIYIIVILTISKFNQYSELFYIGIAKIISTAFLVEWFFTGIENFRYVTRRGLAIKILYVIAVFAFIRTRDDYKVYFILTISTVIVNALINIVYARYFVKIRLRELLNISYLKKNCILGVYSIMTSMYLTFNVMYLGLVSNNMQVGYYTTSFKIYMVILGLFSSFTNVMLPRMSALLAGNERDRFKELIEKSFRAMCMFSIPIITGTVIFAPEIIYLLSGKGYEGAIIPMRIIMPSLLFVGIAQVLALQIMTPMKKDKVLFVASVLGALISIVINITIVPYLESIGSAIVLLSSEFVVTTTYVIYILQHRIIPIPFDSVWKNCLLSVPVVAVCLLCKTIIENQLISIVIAVPSTVICWIVCKNLFTSEKQFI